MTIYTSYFGNIKKLPKDMVLINVSGKAPDWFYSDSVTQRKFSLAKYLAPKYNWWNEWHEKFKDNLESEESKEWYTKQYVYTVLNPLKFPAMRMEADKSVENLLKFIGSEMLKYGDVCLLCHETPEKFCHRHIIANWLKEVIGVKCEVKEWGDK